MTEKIKEKLLERFGELILQVILIGSAVSVKETCGRTDIDIVAIVDDDTDRFGFVREAAGLLVQLSKMEGAMISLYPIHQSVYEKSPNQFINNVRTNGRLI